MAKDAAEKKRRNHIRKIRLQRGWSAEELVVRWQLEQNRDLFAGNLEGYRHAEIGELTEDWDIGSQIFARTLGVTLDYLYAQEGNPIRKIRLQRGWSIEEFTARNQLQWNWAFYDSDLELLREAEAGEDTNPVIRDTTDYHNAQTLAQALGVEVDDLYPPNSTGKTKRKTKKKRHLVALK